MTKIRKSLFKLQGTLGGLTFVDSDAYGQHLRRERGTVKKATINSSLAANAKSTNVITSFAKPLLHAFKEIGDGFTQKDLWQMMMSRMFKAGEHSPSALFKSLEGLDLNKSYALERLASPLPLLKGNRRGSEYIIELDPARPAHFPQKLKAECYYYEVYCTWLDAKAKRCEWESAETDWMLLSHSPKQYELSFAIPSWAKYCVVVLKVQGGNDEQPIESFASMGMRVMGGGKI